MKILIKLIAALLVLVIVAVGGLAVFVKVYLTEERLKQIIVPEAEAALGRSVEIGGIDVSLFKGISVRDFGVKEKDGSTDFVRAKAFVLRYDLMSLLEGRVDISRLSLEDPFIRITRNKAGAFNFETMAVLAGKKPAGEPAPIAQSAALPVALSVQGISVSNARLEVRDALGEIPDVDGQADLDLALNVSKDLSSITYGGKAGFGVDLRYGTVAPSARGTVNIDMARLAYSVDMEVDQQKLNVAGEVKDYRATPKVLLEVTSKALSIDRLLALASGLPATGGETGKKEAPPVQGTSGKGQPLPEGLTVDGSIKIDRTTYRDLAVKDFLVAFHIRQGILTVENLTAGVADGSVKSAATADLNRPDLAWNGTLGMTSVQLAELVKGLQPKAAGTLEGAMNTDLTFKGTGKAWPTIQKTLDLSGTYGAQNLVIRAPVTEGVANLLGLGELREMKFERADGNVRVENGVLRLKSKMGGEVLSVDAEGDIGLDGKLDLPVAMHISEALGKKLREKSSLSGYVIKEQGETTLNLKLAGTLEKPRPTLDEKMVQKKVEEEVTKKATEVIGDLLQGKDKKKSGETGGEETGDGQKEKAPSPAEQLIKGILGTGK